MTSHHRESKCVEVMLLLLQKERPEQLATLEYSVPYSITTKLESNPPKLKSIFSTISIDFVTCRDLAAQNNQRFKNTYN